MTPFQEFRLWTRQAPAGERAVAALAGLLMVALVGWLLVPGDSDSSEATSVGTTAGAESSPGAGDSTSTVASGSQPQGGAGQPTATATAGSGSGSGASSPAAGSTQAGSGDAGCVSPPGTAKGVTATEIKVAVSLLDLAGPASNSLFGLPSADEGAAWYAAMIDAVNAGGGIACRKVVPTFFKVNGVDSSARQKACLDIAQGGFYVDIDAGAFGNFPEKHCLAQHQVPFFGNSFLFADEANAFYPYLFAFQTFDRTYRNAIFALRDRGFFSDSNGFKKLGFIYRSCNTAVVATVTDALHRAGISDAQLVTYNVGCPSAFASPSDLQQAILKFQSSGVTHMTTVDFLGDFGNFTKIAEQQRFRPKYGLADDNIIAISYGSLRPDPANTVGAIAISPLRSGEERTPGMTPTPATVRCDAILKKANIKPTYQSSAGFACDQLWMFQAAVEHAPSMQPTALATGLQKAKSVDFAFPGGPNDFSGPRTTTGGQFWRATQFMANCQCWQVIDATFHPSYP